jgi:hypothetical protein
MWTEANRWRRVSTMYDEERSEGSKKGFSPQIVPDVETRGWGFFTEEISFFLTDFFEKRLNPEDKLIFFSYYITGMTLEEISERFYNDRQVNKFSGEEECDEDDSTDIRHDSHQALHKKLVNINKMLSHAWQYSDRWREE